MTTITKRSIIILVGVSTLKHSTPFTLSTSLKPQSFIQMKQEETPCGATPNRRIFLSTLISASVIIPCQQADAVDPLFRPNPLTNPILEKMRILDQDYADNVKYSGELAPGSPAFRDSYAKLLVPVLYIERDLVTLSTLLSDEPTIPNLSDAKKILDQKYFIKIEFKKIFNAFADNIYYTDPDRANAYLGGGATPKNEQSIAYLLRNEILTNLENLQAEVDYLIKTKEPEYDDLKLYVKAASDNMKKYLELVPPNELEAARVLLKA